MNCDKCGKPMAERNGPRGAFLGCTGYPECKNTAQMKPSQNQTFAKAPSVDKVTKEPVAMYVSYAKDLFLAIIESAENVPQFEELDNLMQDCVKLIKSARNSFAIGWKN